jgi:DNA-binding LytR/AlgR family response regulator
MITALLVDDEPKAIERLAALLESFPGIEVIGTACDVSDAERFLSGRSPDVVFLDINRPGRLRRIR